MEVRLFKNGPADHTFKRSTVMLDGRQIGFVDDRPGAAVLCIRHIDADTAEALKEEVERIKGHAVDKVAVPVAIPPELQETDDELPGDDIDFE